MIPSGLDIALPGYPLVVPRAFCFYIGGANTVAAVIIAFYGRAFAAELARFVQQDFDLRAAHQSLP